MKIGTTLSGYLARIYTINMLWLLAALLGVIYLFDTVELLRRAGKAEDVPLVLVLQMGLLKLPEVGQILFPFAILFSAMYTFWQLTRCYELIVVRAAGFSVWQFMAPVLGVAVLTGLLQMSLINPVGAVLVGKFEQLENTYLNRQTSQIAVFKEGLWLRQAIPAGSSTQNPEGYVILHAEKVKQPGWALKNVSVLFFDESDTFLQRLDADSASLQNGYWDFDHAVIHKKDGKTRQDSGAVLPTQLTIQDVEDSFASPDTMSFWHLPSYIRTLEETGFDASRLRAAFAVCRDGVACRDRVLAPAAQSWRARVVYRRGVRRVFDLLHVELFAGSGCLSADSAVLGRVVPSTYLLFAWSCRRYEP